MAADGFAEAWAELSGPIVAAVRAVIGAQQSVMAMRDVLHQLEKQHAAGGQASESTVVAMEAVGVLCDSLVLVAARAVKVTELVGSSSTRSPLRG